MFLEKIYVYHQNKIVCSLTYHHALPYESY